MSSPQIATEANQLLQFMIANRKEVMEGKDDGKHGIVLYYEGDAQFFDSYKPYIEQLRSAKLISLHPRPSWIILGFGTIQASFFGEQLSLEDQIALQQERYTLAEQQALESLLAVEEAKRNRKFTLLQIYKEYVYWSKFSISVLMKAVTTYLTLTPEKQFGLQYLRGILRNEGLIEEQAPKLKAKKEAEPPKIIPSVEFGFLKRRAAWVNQHLDMVRFNSLSMDERVSYIQELEAQYHE